MTSQYSYETGGETYIQHRRTDPRIEAQVVAALGLAETIVNVGAGTGSYEPKDRYVIAVEPSPGMRQRRLANGKGPAVAASAELLPFDDLAFDAAMSTLSVHHWQDLEKGLSELCRVAKGAVVLLTLDGDAIDDFWGTAYFPELAALEKTRVPKINRIVKALGGHCTVEKIPIPLDCTDGFIEAYYGRPEALLDPSVRGAQSSWGLLEKGMEAILVERLRKDLESGEWDKKYGHLRTQASYEGSLTLVASYPE